jgi:hypothetical protein
MRQGWRSHHVVTSNTPFMQAIGKSDIAERGGAWSGGVGAAEVVVVSTARWSALV